MSDDTKPVARVTKYFFNDQDELTEEGLTAYKGIVALTDPVFDLYMSKGYSPRDIMQLISMTVTDTAGQIYASEKMASVLSKVKTKLKEANVDANIMPLSELVSKVDNLKENLSPEKLTDATSKKTVKNEIEELINAFNPKANKSDPSLN